MEEIFLVDDKYKRLSEDKKAKFKKNMLGAKKDNKRWIISIVLISFVLSVFFLFISNMILEDVNNVIAIFVVLFIVLVGIISDIIGIAVTAADEAPFHAMASRKYYGSKKSIKLIRNADKVSSFCNDVVGDICGIISGTASAMLVVSLTLEKSPVEKLIYGLLTSGVIAAITVGGKAAGKTLAISNSNYIVYKVGVTLQFISGNTMAKGITNNKSGTDNKQNTNGKSNSKSNGKSKTNSKVNTLKDSKRKRGN